MKKTKIPIEKAVGLSLEHDITKIDKDNNFKGAFFKKGYVIKKEDIPVLRSLGKHYIYKFQPAKDDVHENDFATELAPYLAGDNIYFPDEPSEGKISFYSAIKGLFKVDINRLFKLNNIKELSFPTIGNNFPVEHSKLVASFRIIPLFSKRKTLEKAKNIASKPIVKVVPYKIKKANLIITGNEIYNGLVEDRFETKIRSKLSKFGVVIERVRIAADDIKMIKNVFDELIDTQLLMVTGGSSVDPDDVTKTALKRCGVKFIREGNPIQPANNFTMGYFEGVSVCIIPAGALFYKASALDIFLPRILAKDRMTNAEISRYALGGLCHFCEHCTYPICPFGRC